MNCDLTFDTPDKLAREIGPALLPGKVAKSVAMEKMQMKHLLEALARTSIPQYPVRVRHTTDQVPDFQLLFRDRRIAAELTRIKFQDVEHGRALQEQGMKETLVISNLLPRQEGPRKKPVVVQEGFGPSQMLFSPSVAEEDDIWRQQAKDTLNSKSRVIARNDFAHGDEDWLVLVDTMGAELFESQNRQDTLAELLSGFWKPGWFSHAFLQDNYFRWHMMFTRHESTVLRME